MVQHDLQKLAPLVEANVRAVIDDLKHHNIEIVIYETIRTDELARLYYELARSKAINGKHTWHTYGFAVDIIHPHLQWQGWPTYIIRNGLGRYVGGDYNWWPVVVAVFKAHGFHWGGDWTHIKDTSHFQWAWCDDSPPTWAQKLYEENNVEEVWRRMRVT